MSSPSCSSGIDVSDEIELSFLISKLFYYSSSGCSSCFSSAFFISEFSIYYYYKACSGVTWAWRSVYIKAVADELRGVASSTSIIIVPDRSISATCCSKGE